MSVNTQKQRNYLYGKSFMKWPVDRRLLTASKTAVESSLSIQDFINATNEKHFQKMCESISDYETMVEVLGESFPGLRPEVDRIKKEKLTVLKKQANFQEEADKHQKKVEENKKAIKDLTKIKPKKRRFFKFLRRSYKK